MPYQLVDIYALKNTFGILRVGARLHNCQEEFGRVVLQLQNQIHPSLGKRIDVILDEGGYDVQTIRLMQG